MFHPTILYLLVAAAMTLAFQGSAASAADSQLAHVVYFSLKDHSDEARAKFVASCKKYLTGHDGAVSISVGVIAKDVVEPVSDREFDVSIHVVFKNKEANAKYQKSERHQKFIEENKASWAKVRVFDSYLSEP
jgi:hypothetical protein